MTLILNSPCWAACFVPNLTPWGGFATDALRQVYASKAFIGVDGISPKYGCIVPACGEADIVRPVIQCTRGPVTVVAGHSKWGVVSNFFITKHENS
jgi:DeoR/GlpR family transcriptional regulator of sugar metabolism